MNWVIAGKAMFSLDVQGQARLHQDSLPVLYPRIRLRSIRVFGRLFLPFAFLVINFSFEFFGAASWPFAFAWGFAPLIITGVLRPSRIVTAHCFFKRRRD